MARFIEFKLYTAKKNNGFYLFFLTALCRPSFKILILYKYFDLGLPKHVREKENQSAVSGI